MMIKSSWTRFISAVCALCVVISMFASLGLTASAATVDEELASLKQTLFSNLFSKNYSNKEIISMGGVIEDWVLTNYDNDKITIQENGRTIVTNCYDFKMTTASCYDLSGGFYMELGSSAMFNQTDNHRGDHAHYFKFGDLKLVMTDDHSDATAYYKLYNGSTLIASALAKKLNNFNGTYTLTLEDGKLTVTNSNYGGTVTWILADGETEATSVDVSNIDLSCVKIELYRQGQVGYSWTSTYPYWGFILNADFPFDTVAEFGNYIRSLNGDSMDKVIVVKRLFDYACENGSAELAAALETYRADIISLTQSKYDDLDILVEGNGSLLVDGEPYDGSAIAYFGDSHTFTAVADPRSNFVNWVDADGKVLTTNKEYTVTIRSSMYAKAVFKDKIYADWDFVTTEGGSIMINGKALNASDEFEVGTIGELTAVPDTDNGYVFLYWVDKNGNIISSGSTYSIVFGKTDYIKAVFSDNEEDKINYELSTIKKTELEGFTTDTWTPDTAGAFTFNDAEKTVTLSDRMEHWLETKNSYDLSNGFTMNYHSDFTWINFFGGSSDSYVKIGDLYVYYSGNTSSNAVLKVGTSPNNIIATYDSGYYFTDRENSFFTGDWRFEMEKIGDTQVFKMYSAKLDGYIPWTVNGSTSTSIDITAFDFSNVKVKLLRRWLSDSSNLNTAARTGAFSNFKLTTDLPFNTVNNIQPYINAVDIRNDRAVALAKEYVALLNNGSDKLKASFDASRLDCVKYNISATAGGTVYAGDAAFVNDCNVNLFKAGAVLKLTAVADDGSKFEYWADADGNIKSTDSSISIYLTADGTTVTAVFTRGSSEAGQTVSVYFRNRSGRNIATMDIAYGDQITLPDGSDSYGYTFCGWIVNGEIKAPGEKVNIYADAVISAKYVKNTDTYTVTAVGSTVDVDGIYNYNDLVTVRFETYNLEVGTFFGGWMVNGKIVSCDTVYSFYVGSDVTVSAVISNEYAKKNALVEITDASLISDGAKATFLINRYLPSDYILIESGAIITNGDFTTLTLDDVNGTTVRKSAALSVNGCGQFRQTVGSASGKTLTVTVAGYLTYADAEGNVNTVYSTPFSLVINEAK